MLNLSTYLRSIYAQYSFIPTKCQENNYKIQYLHMSVHYFFDKKTLQNVLQDSLKQEHK